MNIISRLCKAAKHLYTCRWYTVSLEAVNTSGCHYSVSVSFLALLIFSAIKQPRLQKNPWSTAASPLVKLINMLMFYALDSAVYLRDVTEEKLVLCLENTQISNPHQSHYLGIGEKWNLTEFRLYIHTFRI